MIFRSFAPPLQLEPYVDVIHLRHFECPPGMALPFKPYPPRAEQCLAFYVRGSETTEHVQEGLWTERPRSVISGQFTSQINRHITREFLMILVVFRPGALFRLTGLPFGALRDRAIDAEALLGPACCQLNKSLSGCEDYGEIIALITNALTVLAGKKIIAASPIDEAILWLSQSKQPVTVRELSAAACLSTRQLERKFDERLGVSPKTFLRILRFSRSYFLYLRKPSLGWESIAGQCGYTDYQHLSRDYQQFTGWTAAQFFRKAEMAAPERVLGLVR